MNGKSKILVLASLLVALALVLVTGYFQRFDLFQYLPSKADEEYSVSDTGVTVQTQTQEPFSGRLRSEYEGRTDIYSYKNGMLHGMNVSYQNGKIVEIGQWENDRQQGRFQLFTEDGVLVDDGYFENGERSGPTKQYYPTGSLRVEANYVNGQLNGTARQYSEEGALSIESNYASGVLHGKSLYYYEDGKLKLEANYLDGIPDGAAIYWTEDGIRVEGSLDASGVFTPDGL